MPSPHAATHTLNYICQSIPPFLHILKARIQILPYSFLLTTVIIQRWFCQEKHPRRGKKVTSHCGEMAKSLLNWPMLWTWTVSSHTCTLLSLDFLIVFHLCQTPGLRGRQWRNTAGLQICCVLSTPPPTVIPDTGGLAQQQPLLPTATSDPLRGIQSATGSECLVHQLLPRVISSFPGRAHTDQWAAFMVWVFFFPWGALLSIPRQSRASSTWYGICYFFSYQSRDKRKLVWYIYICHFMKAIASP